VARLVTVNGLRVAFRTAGEGPLALLLHGFPDTPATWRHLAPRLVAAGFRVVTPWMRGYAPTDVPADGRYDADARAADANALHDALDGDGDAVVVGHDWGADTAYAAVAAEPERWRRVVTLAVPPEAALTHAPRHPRQLRRSWYMAAAQVPWEQWAPDRARARIERLWTDWSPGYRPVAEDLQPLRATMEAPGALAAMLGYYRAARRGVVRDGLGGDGAPVPPRPTLYLHGRDDGCIDARWAERARPVLAGGHPASSVEVVHGVGHFLHLEDPAWVGARIEAWLRT
jgi:pimeloyl-ACP methyl ester carboxylesterase